MLGLTTRTGPLASARSLLCGALVHIVGRLVSQSGIIIIIKWVLAAVREVNCGHGVPTSVRTAIAMRQRDVRAKEEKNRHLSLARRDERCLARTFDQSNQSYSAISRKTQLVGFRFHPSRGDSCNTGLLGGSFAPRTDFSANVTRHLGETAKDALMRWAIYSGRQLQWSAGVQQAVGVTATTRESPARVREEHDAAR